MYRRFSSLVLTVVAVITLIAAIAPVAADHGSIHGINPANMDFSADPRENFYRFANGGWLDRAEIPPDESRYGVFTELDDATTAYLIDLMNQLAAAEDLAAGSDESKAVAIYEQGIDLKRRNELGLRPIASTLDQIDAIADLNDLHVFLETSQFLGLSGFFPIYSSPDLKDSSINIANVAGPTLWLPNRDYYLEDDEANIKIRAAYLESTAKLLELIGYDDARAAHAAEAVYDLERRLAEPTLTREEQQNISLFYNPTTVDQLAAIYPMMDWSAYLATLGLQDVESANVDEIKYLKFLDTILRETELAAIKDHLKLQLLWGYRANLSEELQATAFDFRGKVLSGLTEQPPTDERVLAQVDGLVGEAVGKLYVAEKFPPAAKQQISELVEALVASFRHRLETNAWMTDEARGVALDKLAKMRVKVGYPDVWRTYETVEIGDSYFASVLSAENAEMQRTLAQIGKPVDRNEWGMTPQTVNAYYNPLNNEIVFPAAILQPPFFDYQADAAVNFGAIGYVIGHEITHGFDLQGSQFDANGNLADWWTDEDRTRFEALNEQLAAQYFAIEVMDGVFIDGQITVTENAADLGGIQVAYDALNYYMAEGNGSLPTEPDPPVIALADFTPEQRFFVAAATVWREKIRDEALLTLVKSDSHSPASARATQPLRNMDAFYPAFAIKSGDAMYLPPDERIVIW